MKKICKDCRKYCNKIQCPLLFWLIQYNDSRMEPVNTHPKDFCSWWEKKENEGHASTK